MAVKLGRMVAIGSALLVGSGVATAQPSSPTEAVDDEIAFDEPTETIVNALGDGDYRVRFPMVVAGSYRSLAEAQRRALEIIDKLKDVPGLRQSVAEGSLPRMRVGQHGELLDCRVVDDSWCGPYADEAVSIRTDEGCTRCEEHYERTSESNMLSIERSSDFPGLTPGYYVVAIGSGGEKRAAEVVRRARRAGVRAYVRHVLATKYFCRH